MLALTFQVGSARAAVDLRRVRSVVPRVRLTPSAGGPVGVAGGFVYRGRVVPVIDLNRLAGAGDSPDHLGSRIILVSHPAAGPDALIGLLAARVAEVCELPDTPAETDALTGSLLGPAVADGAGVIRLLDPDLLLPRPVGPSRD